MFISKGVGGKGWHSLPESMEGTIDIVVDGKTYSTELAHISKSGLRIPLQNGLIQALKKGMSLSNCAIAINGELQGHLNLVVSGLEDTERRRVDDGIAPTALLGVEDDTSSARLWELIYNIQVKSNRREKRISLDTSNLPRIPGRGLYTEEARQQRLSFLRENTASELDIIEKTSYDPTKLTSNVENFIGSLEIPLGVAGPLLINGQHARGLYYAPMATSEGALVASATRGAIALSRSGGVVTRVLGQRMLRAPLFELGDIDQALFMAAWLRDHFDEIKEVTKRFSNYADLKEIDPQVMGNSIHVHFVYECGDAAGQNMTTTCTWHACLWILRQIDTYKRLTINNFLVEGVGSSDKKVSYLSFIQGRGIRVQAEAVLPAEVCQQVLKLAPEQLFAGYNKMISGSKMIGLIGLNCNVANTIAAIFAATGQDIACVHESSIGNLHIDLTDQGDLYVNITLPALVVGTVGGGTNLPHQKQCLDLMSCAGVGNARKLAEIIAGYCLALDLSTMSAIGSGHFARAHERLGRNRPVNHLKLGDIDEKFFERLLKESLNDDAIQVSAAEPIKNLKLGSSIITELTSRKVNKPLGHFPFKLSYTDGQGKEHIEDVIVKVKPTSAEVIHTASQVAAMCDSDLAAEYDTHKESVGFKKCDQRELALCRQKEKAFTDHAPKIFGIYESEEREAFVIVEEYLRDMELLDSANDVSDWTDEHIKAAIAGIAQHHGLWYKRDAELRKQKWIGHYPNANRMTELSRLWELLGRHAAEEFPEWFTVEDLEAYRKLLRELPQWWGRLDKMPKTLIHGDFNPRNVCFRKTEAGPQMCAYDWELATIHVPQRDLVEMLAFVLDPSVTKQELQSFVDYHRRMLGEAIGEEINAEQWWEGFKYACWDFMINRVSQYIMGHTFQYYEFMERVVNTMRTMLRILSSDE